MRSKYTQKQVTSINLNAVTVTNQHLGMGGRLGEGNILKVLATPRWGSIRFSPDRCFSFQIADHAIHIHSCTSGKGMGSASSVICDGTAMVLFYSGKKPQRRLTLASRTAHVSGTFVGMNGLSPDWCTTYTSSAMSTFALAWYS